MSAPTKIFAHGRNGRLSWIEDYFGERPNSDFVDDLLARVPARPSRVDIERVQKLVELTQTPAAARPTRPLKVFLCHASDDKPSVRKLYQRLKRDGHQPWLDDVDIQPGELWKAAIATALKTSDIAVVCLSKLAVEKVGVVQAEIKDILDLVALRPNNRIFLVPVRLEDCDIPERLRDYQWVDLYARSGYRRLRDMLAAQAEIIKGSSKS